MSIVVHGQDPDAEEPGFPNREDLADVLELIHGEVRTAKLLVRQIDLRDTLAPHMVTAVRESLLSRIFRLRHFFFERPTEEWELVAADYFPNPRDWTAVRPPAPPHLSHWLDDLGVWVMDRVSAHPRERVPEEAWPLASLVQVLEETHRAFCEAIVEHHGGPFGNIAWPESSEEDIVLGSSEGPPSNGFDESGSQGRTKRS